MAERGFLDQAMDFADGVVGTLEAMGGPQDGRTPASAASASSAPASAFAGGETARGTASPSQRWRIVEVIREDSELAYVVTNGRDDAECSSRELAERVLRALA